MDGNDSRDMPCHLSAISKGTFEAQAQQRMRSPNLTTARAQYRVSACNFLCELLRNGFLDGLHRFSCASRRSAMLRTVKHSTILGSLEPLRWRCELIPNLKKRRFMVALWLEHPSSQGGLTDSTGHSSLKSSITVPIAVAVVPLR